MLAFEAPLRLAVFLGVLALMAQDKRPSAETAQRAKAEAEERRRMEAEGERPTEIGGRKGPEPTRFGDWEKKGIVSDF